MRFKRKSTKRFSHHKCMTKEQTSVEAAIITPFYCQICFQRRYLTRWSNI